VSVVNSKEMVTDAMQNSTLPEKNKRIKFKQKRNVSLKEKEKVG
jgi:hypothetical protein